MPPPADEIKTLLGLNMMSRYACLTNYLTYYHKFQTIFSCKIKHRSKFWISPNRVCAETDAALPPESRRNGLVGCSPSSSDHSRPRVSVITTRPPPSSPSPRARFIKDVCACWEAACRQVPCSAHFSFDTGRGESQRSEANWKTILWVDNLVKMRVFFIFIFQNKLNICRF